MFPAKLHCNSVIDLLYIYQLVLIINGKLAIRTEVIDLSSILKGHFVCLYEDYRDNR